MNFGIGISKFFSMKIERHGIRRGITLLPNLITTASLFCGFFSIMQSIRGRFVFAAWLVILAAFFDFLDGRIARMTRSQSDFGVEYDSLSDLTTFCLAPAILVYTWSLFDFGKLGIAVCFLFFACGALRLARFNVQMASVERVDFQGLPTPTAGGTLVSYAIFYEHLFGPGKNPSFFVIVMTVALALLMVSNIRYRSFKKIKRASFLFFVFVVGAVFIVAAQPEVMFFAAGMTYIGVGIGEWLWKSPEKIRGLKDLLKRFYLNRREKLVYEDEDEAEEETGGRAGAQDNVVTLKKKEEP